MVQTHPFIYSDSSDLFYPESDGQPMSENTQQYRWIVCLTENITHLLADQTAFVGADLSWYPVEGSPEILPNSSGPELITDRDLKSLWSPRLCAQVSLVRSQQKLKITDILLANSRSNAF